MVSWTHSYYERRESVRAGRPKTPLVLTKEEHEQLKSMVNSRSLPHGLVDRARIVLMAAEGAPNLAIAKEVGLSGQNPAISRAYLNFLN